MSKNENMKKSAIILFVLMLMSKVLGLARVVVMNLFYKPSAITDAYLTASSVPNLLFGIVAGGLVSTFIPIYSKVIAKEGEKQAKRFMNNILTIVFIITMIFLVFGLIFTEELVLINAIGYTGERLELAVKFTKVTLFALLTNGMYSIFTGYHQYEGRFYVTPMTGFFLNGAIITSIVISAYTSPIVMVYGLVFGSLLQLIFSYTIAKLKGGFKYNVTIDFKDQYIKPMLVMAIPIIFGSSITQINGIIDRTMASQLAGNGPTIIDYSSRISDAVFSLFVSSLTTVMYPTIIRQATSKNYEGLKGSITEIMNLISIIIIPAMVGVIILANPIVAILFKNEASIVRLISNALIGGIIGLFGMSIKDVLVRSFYSINDSKTPVFASMIQIVVNVALNFLLMPRFGAAGLTLATSLASFVGAIILYIKLNSRLGGLYTRRLITTVSKISGASFAMGVVVYIVHQLLNVANISIFINLVISVAVGGIVYLIVLWFIKVPEFEDLIEMAKEKLQRGKKK